jgi:tRNA-binding EMAP/Myf-like protein
MDDCGETRQVCFGIRKGYPQLVKTTNIVHTSTCILSDVKKKKSDGVLCSEGQDALCKARDS